MEGVDWSRITLHSFSLPTSQRPHPHLPQWPHLYHSGLCSRQSCPCLLLNIVCHLWGSSSEYFGPCPNFTCLNMNVSHNTIPHLCWERLVNDGSVMLYAFRCDDLMRPFMNKDYSSIEQLDNDISYVCKSLINTSLSTIPSMKPHHRNHMWVFDSYPTCVGVVMLPIGSGKHQVAQGSVRLYEIGKRVNVKLPPTWLSAKPVLNVSTFKNAMNHLLSKVLAASDLTPPNLKARPFLLMAPL